MRDRVTWQILFFTAAAIMLSSCLPGIRTARKFIKEKESIAVMIVPPAFTYLGYYPYPEDPEVKQFESSSSLEESEFLYYMDEERASSYFWESLIDQLQQYQLKVFTPEHFDEFLSLESERYIFTIAQTELIEYEDFLIERALIDTFLYQQAFLIRNLERNTWLEFVEVDTPDDYNDMEVLYSTFLASDLVEGRFRYRVISGEVYYEYDSQLLTLEDLYRLNRHAGSQNARYIFDFLLNRHVQQNASPLFVKPAKFRYNVQSGSLRRAGENQMFILLEQP